MSAPKTPMFLSLPTTPLPSVVASPRFDFVRDCKLDVDEVQASCERLVGEGQFAQVFTGTFQGELVAIKVQAITNEQMEGYLTQELSILKRVFHPNLLTFKGAARGNNVVYIVTNYAAGGELRGALQSGKLQSYEERVEVLVGVARALDYLHQRHIIHRDVKTTNVVLDEAGCAILCDFGLATKLRNSSRLSVCGTDEFMAPEVSFGMEYAQSADIFSFGVLVLETVTRRIPGPNFLERRPMDGFAFEEDELRAALPSDCPASLAELLVQCVAVEAGDRPSAADIVEWLQDLSADLRNQSGPPPERDTIHVPLEIDPLVETATRADILAHIADARAAMGKAGESSLLPRLWVGPSAEHNNSDHEAGKDTVGESEFSVLQFNVLAEGLSSPPHVPPPREAAKERESAYGDLEVDHADVCLDWSLRRWRLLEAILEHEPDIVALQECDRFSDFIEPALRIMGYNGAFQPKDHSPCIPFGFYSDGVALFWNTSKFLHINTTQSGSPPYLVSHLQHVGTHREILVATTHLKAKEGDDNEALRTQQITALLNTVHTQMLATSVDDIVLAGDFNTTHKSTPKQVATCIPTVLKWQQPSLASAYPLDDGALFSTYKQRNGSPVKRLIDYIWHSPSLQCTSYLSTPSPSVLLPCLRYPSDHIALIATFQPLELDPPLSPMPLKLCLSPELQATPSATPNDTPNAKANDKRRLEDVDEGPRASNATMFEGSPRLYAGQARVGNGSSHADEERSEDSRGRELLPPSRRRRISLPALHCASLCLVVLALLLPMWISSAHPAAAVPATAITPSVCLGNNADANTNATNVWSPVPVCPSTVRVRLGLWHVCQQYGAVLTCSEFYGSSQLGHCGDTTLMDKYFCSGTTVCGVHVDAQGDAHGFCSLRKTTAVLLVMFAALVGALLLGWCARWWVVVAVNLLAWALLLVVCVWFAAFATELRGSTTPNLFVPNAPHTSVRLSASYYVVVAAAGLHSVAFAVLGWRLRHGTATSVRSSSVRPASPE